ncbi:hypothetical protein PFISCL1PPCAC_20005 [Pristionchus fissidentatus]|uniref:peptidylprolyl isomerase n=1 Tax=Pristionchus fissidentatus TaxID=1538716 RepID=A0AAV5WEC4_9BILA|nr:hypothetical protein PFISCL1PPCAC_20005 [Pristionchus fissidentatus]
MEDIVGDGSQGSVSSDGFENIGIERSDHDFIESDNFVEVVKGRRAISSGEPSLDGSIDDERNAVSDSEIWNAARTETIAKQARGPSSDALEGDCLAEHAQRIAKSNSEWEDVLGSGELMKRVEKEGDGERPTDGYCVKINVIDCLYGLDSHECLHFVLGFSFVIDAWELVVKLMRVGEKCTVESSPRFAYGHLGLDPHIPPNQHQQYTIELISSTKMDYEEIPKEELTAFIVKLKERGNFYFSRKEYEKAIFVYKRAVSTWNGVEWERDEGMTRVLSALHSNLAVCYAKVCEWTICLQSANDALLLHSHNGKALFRKGQALSRLGEMEDAVKFLKEACKIDPNNCVIQGELELASRCGAEFRVKERQLYRKMLTGIASEEEDKKHGENKKETNNRMFIIICSLGTILIAVLFHVKFNLT